MAESEENQVEVNVDQENSTEQNAGKSLIEKPLVLEKVTGTVKWFNIKNGYGFIRRDDINEDIFVHQTGIIKTNKSKNKGVRNGEKVQFDIVQGQKGLEAANLTGPNGEPVKGGKTFYRNNRRSFHPKKNLIKKNGNNENNIQENFVEQSSNLPQNNQRKGQQKPKINLPNNNQIRNDNPRNDYDQNRYYQREPRNQFDQRFPRGNYRPRSFFNRNRYMNNGQRNMNRRFELQEQISPEIPNNDRYVRDPMVRYQGNYNRPRQGRYRDQRRFDQPRNNETQEIAEQN